MDTLFELFIYTLAFLIICYFRSEPTAVPTTAPTTEPTAEPPIATESTAKLTAASTTVPTTVPTAEPPIATEPTDIANQLRTHTNKRLRAIAQKLGIDVKKAKTKDAIIGVLIEYGSPERLMSLTI